MCKLYSDSEVNCTYFIIKCHNVANILYFSKSAIKLNNYLLHQNTVTRCKRSRPHR